MRKVDFLIIGSQKAGTSALDYYLRQHSEIGMAHKKELHFFDNETFFSQENIDYLSYEKNFDWDDGKSVYGEATPIYIYWQPCCRRIWEYNKNIKLIALLRNPIERAFSHWTMEFNRKKDRVSFEEALKEEKIRCKEALPHQHRIYSYIDRGFYSEQVRRFKRFFSDEQLLFIKYERFKEHPKKVLNQIFDFLEVRKTNLNIVKTNIHTGDYKFEMSANHKKYLLDIFKNDISEIGRILNWDCSDWKV